MEAFDFKCKHCGGSLDKVVGYRSVGKCTYCGAKQTLPKLQNDKRANLFDRANHLRRNNEFDKAEALYNEILNDDPSDPEAYWSLVLCRFGIEYVEDKETKERKPTINRTQLTSIFADENYKAALDNADEEQKKLYEQEARTINEIQKGILEIAQKEEPFDVFICYKEKDENGNRSRDSVLAHELYRELTRDGYKVFFARETLRDKIGSAYEPYIFSALNSAKVMVVLGAKKEHFEAVWVRNEWSRFLGQIKNGEKKTLIPVYKDIDAYDLPQEFANLQALDMDRIGYLQELISGVENIVRIYHDDEEARIEEERHEKQKKKSRIFVPIIALLLAAAIGLSAFFFLNQNKGYVSSLKNDTYSINVKASTPILPPDCVLNAEKVTSGKDYTLVSSAIPSNVKEFHVYDLSLVSEGKPYTLDGSVTITMPLPDDVDPNKAAVYYVSDGGEAEEHKCTVSGKNISFVTTHFSLYVIAEKIESDFSYKQNEDGTISITGYRGTATSFIIPEKIDGKTVTAIDYKAFEGKDNIVSITIPHTVTSIRASAFSGCTSINSITIPESVESMGVTVFYGWSSKQTVIVSGHSSAPSEWSTRWSSYSNAKIVYSLKKVEFNANGGKGNMSAIYSEMNQTATLPKCTFTKIGYTFAGWSTTQGGEIAVADGKGFKLGSEDKYTLYAVWQPNDNKLSFDANGGIGKMADITIKSDAKATLPASTFTKEGYTFAGWATAKNGTSVYSDESEYTMGVSETNTLYAVWAPNSNTVIFNANGGTGSMNPQNINTDATASLSANAFTKVGYTFEGWSDTKGGNVKYANGAEFTMNSSESITLYAVWGAITNKVTLHANNGTIEKLILNGQTDGILTLPKNTYTYAGYTFIGWSTTEGGNVIYDDEAKYTVTAYNADLYAIWSANENSIVFNPNGGIGEMANATIKTNDSSVLPLCTFEKVGYIFAGWSTTEGSEIVYCDGATYTMGTETQYTLYAVWEVRDYKITYNLNGGENNLSNPVGFDMETPTITLASPTQTGGTSGRNYHSSSYYRAHYYYIPSTIKSITITVDTTIPYGAFHNCNFVETITIPTTVTDVGDYAYQNCTATILETYETKTDMSWDGTDIAADFCSGTGTQADPYIISTGAELALLSQRVNDGETFAGVYFKFSKNINLNGKTFTTIGSKNNKFEGAFDGNGFVIRNFAISTNESYVGLFGYVTGTIQNLGVIGTVTVSGTSANAYVGMLTGYSTSSIKNCFAIGTVSVSSSNTAHSGGLVGYSEGNISDSYANVTVTSTSTGYMAYAGGLAGYVKSGSISGSYAAGDVKAYGTSIDYSRNGGLVGYLDTSVTIANCYRSALQLLTRYTETGSAYCDNGTPASLETIKSYVSSNWSIDIWSFNSIHPTF